MGMCSTLKPIIFIKIQQILLSFFLMNCYILMSYTLCPKIFFKAFFVPFFSQAMKCGIWGLLSYHYFDEAYKVGEFTLLR